MPFDSIDETLRKAFETAWKAGRPEPIERFLPPPEDARFLPTLEELVHVELEFTWKAWKNARPDADTLAPAYTVTQPTDGPPRVETYLQRFPQLDDPEIVLRLLAQERLVRARWDEHRPPLDEYRRRFPDVVPPDWDPDPSSSDEIAPITLDRAQAATLRGPGSLPATPDLPRFFGNYELLAELGRGGMGVVYRARQLAAERMVALKVVRRDYLQSLAQDTQASALERFHNEVQATARLEHQNIIPVYEVGDVDGEPFYTMRYIEGRSLAETLRDGPVSNRQAAEYLVQVTRAIEEAHRQDILHRDLKPQNILIDARKDRPLVTDFGLAKLLTGGGEDLTQSGEIMGSPPYMSPEQARDSSKVTAQTDVYALGATLYHVLTGRPPFQAATVIETVAQVVTREPVPPRQLNPAIDRDLETICLKCLEKEPARRYESARALADEFDRYLRNEPILARPVGTVGRTVRWCRRNPVVATLIVSTLTFLVLALVATLVGYIRTTAALHVAKTSERHARETVDDFFTRVSEDTLLNQPGMQPLRRELLEKALDYYRQFLSERGNDPSIQDELALTHFRIGQITEQVDAPEKALPSYQQALAMQERLVAQRPTDPTLLDDLGNTHSAMGGVLLKRQQWESAIAAYARAAEIRARIATANPDRTEFERKLASSYMNMGVVEKERGQLEKAQTYFLDARAIRRKILVADPQNTPTRRDLAMGCYNLANLYLSFSPADMDAARSSLQEAIDGFQGILREDPSDLTNQYRLAISYRRLGDLNSLASDLDGAGEMYRLAIAQIEPLSQRNPDVPEYRAALARLNGNIGLIHIEQGETALAGKSLDQALEMLATLVREYPEVPHYERDLATTLREIALLEIDAGQIEQARQNLVRSKDHLQRLVQRYPDQAEYTLQLDETTHHLDALEAPPP